MPYNDPRRAGLAAPPSAPTQAALDTHAPRPKAPPYVPPDEPVETIEQALQQIVTPEADEASEAEAEQDIEDNRFDDDLDIPERTTETPSYVVVMEGGPWGGARYTFTHKGRAPIAVVGGEYVWDAAREVYVFQFKAARHG